MRVTLNEESQATPPRFQYPFTGRALRIGDVVDGVYQRQFIYDAMVIRPQCLECGYHGQSGDYTVEVRVGNLKLLLRRSDISNVRRHYQAGDWLDT